LFDFNGIVYKELDPAKKNYEWANKVVSMYRMYWRPLVDRTRLSENRALLYGTNEIPKVIASFKDKDFLRDTDIRPLAILDAFVNAVVEEIVKDPPNYEVKAQDPTSINLKRDDLQLLKNRKILENDIASYSAYANLPDYKVPYEKFNGNAEEFDKMGFDESDPEDVNLYAEHFQRLWYEIAAQAGLNAVMALNEFDETTIRNLVRDIFAVKTIVAQGYVDQISGQIKYDYVEPSELHGIFGKTNDGKNDVCRGRYKMSTVGEWIERVGNDFDFEKQWKYLLFGINFCEGTSYSGFIRGGINYDCCGQSGNLEEKFTRSSLVDFDNAYMFKLYTGYIEWQSPEATSAFISLGDNYHSCDYNYELSNREVADGYKKKANIQFQWYRSYFVATSTISQYLFGFQKVYFQHLEGFNDTYSNGTLCYYQDQGLSAVEIAKPYLNIANFTFYRMLWLIYKCKPEREDFVIDELITLTKALQREYPELAGGVNKKASFESIFQQALEYQHQTHIRLRTYPEIEGRKVQQLPPDGKRPGSGGLDPTAVTMQAVTQWAEANIAAKIGVNPMRIGANPPSRESQGSEEATLNYSFNTTGYVYRMTQYLKKHLCKTTLNYMSDIVKYPDTLPYKFLQNLLGDENFEHLKKLDNQCAHRMAIFLKDYNLAVKKRRMMQAADMALSKGTIDVIQWGILDNTEDPKAAFALLARMQRQTDKRVHRQQMQLVAQQQQGNMAIENAITGRDKMNNQRYIDVANIQKEATIGASQVGADGRIAVKQITVDAEDLKQQAKTRGEKEVIETKANVEQQQPFNAPA